MNNRQIVNEFIIGIVQGKFLESYDRFYDERVVVNDNGVYERKGKKANQLFLRNFMQSIEFRHSFQAVSVLTDGPKSVIEWAWDYTPKGGNRITVQKMVLQTWVNKKIAYETWYQQQPIRVPANWQIHNQYVYQTPH